MYTSEFAPDTGHESDYRAVGCNGLYLKSRAVQPGLSTLIRDLEAQAAQKPEGSYGRRELLAHAERHRATLARQAAPVIDEASEPGETQQASEEELAHLGCSNFPHDSDEYQQERERLEDDGAYYGETAEEDFHRD